MQRFLICGLYDEVVNRADTLQVAHSKSIGLLARNTNKKGRAEMQEIHWLIVRIHPFDKSSGTSLAFFKRKNASREGNSKPFVHAHHSSAILVLSIR